MNNLLARVLTDPSYVAIIVQKLPPAFELVEKELSGNPAIGLLREHVIVGMLMAFLGESQVQPVRRGVQADVDCYVGGLPLSIKTVSGGGGIRIKWTANAVKAEEFMSAYRPQSDLLVIRIVWGREGYIRYVPLAVQEQIFTRLGSRYLDYRAATNTRGVNLSGQAEAAINSHRGTLSISVVWHQTVSSVAPYKKWVDYWRSALR